MQAISLTESILLLNIISVKQYCDSILGTLTLYKQCTGRKKSPYRNFLKKKKTTNQKGKLK